MPFGFPSEKAFSFAGIPTMHAIRKGQVRWVAKGAPLAHRQFHPHNFRSSRVVAMITDPVDAALALFATEPTNAVAAPIPWLAPVITAT